jgi:mannan endo-1,4-beta-mannosidase
LPLCTRPTARLLAVVMAMSAVGAGSLSITGAAAAASKPAPSSKAAPAKTAAGHPPVVASVATANASAWWTVDAAGDVSSEGTATNHGSLSGHRLGHAIVAAAATADGGGYWLVGADGGVFSFGDAHFYGSLGGHPPAHPIVAIAPTPSDDGYWLLGSDGRVYAFGGAPDHGSARGSGFTAIASTPSGTGYWLATASGSVYSFGSAAYHGGINHPSSPVTGIGPSADGGGYWLVEHSGSVLAFGDAAPPAGSAPAPALGIEAAPGGGYVVLTASGPDRFGPASATPAATSGGYPVIGVDGSQLTLNDVPHVFVGMDAYEVGTVWGTNRGCGSELSDAQLDQMFTSLPPGSLFRIWAFQGAIATNAQTHELDWRPLDRVFTHAAAHHQLLVVSLAGLGSGCDHTPWQDINWFNGGFQTDTSANSPTVGSGSTLVDNLTYSQFVQAIVSHYAGNPALGMWEPINEGEAATCTNASLMDYCEVTNSCPDEAAAEQALYFFFTTVGQQIHAIDPKHLVESGTLGGPNCGMQGADFAKLAQSPGIDVLDYHDYFATALGGDDPADSVATRIAQAQAVGKPIIAGEAGATAGSGVAGCPDVQTRTTALMAKLQAQAPLGLDGFLVWNYTDDDTTNRCSLDVHPGDPLLAALTAYANAEH